VKRDLLIRNTNLSLNVQLIGEKDWTDQQIAARCETLSDLAISLYPGPTEVAAAAAP
jgi:hypothetical protein